MFTEKAKMPCKGCILLPICKIKVDNEITTSRFYTAGLDKLINTCSLFDEYYRQEYYEIIIYNVDKLFLHNKYTDSYKPLNYSRKLKIL